MVDWSFISCAFRDDLWWFIDISSVLSRELNNVGKVCGCDIACVMVAPFVIVYLKSYTSIK